MSGDMVNIWQNNANYFKVQFQIFQKPNGMALRTAEVEELLKPQQTADGVAGWKRQVTVGKTRN